MQRNGQSTLLLTLAILLVIQPAAAEVRQGSGRVTLLRVHERGSGYGPPHDPLDVDVVFFLDSEPTGAFGLQLRDDDALPARRAMLDLLRDAFAHGWVVHIDYEIKSGSKKGRVLRLWIKK